MFRPRNFPQFTDFAGKVDRAIRNFDLEGMLEKAGEIVEDVMDSAERTVKNLDEKMKVSEEGICGCWFGSNTGSAPLADITETVESHVIIIDLPGMSKQDIKIEVRKNLLVISGEKKDDANFSHGGYRERLSGKFEREFEIPADADVSRSIAKYENGVLTITVPKRSSNPSNSTITVN